MFGALVAPSCVARQYTCIHASAAMSARHVCPAMCTAAVHYINGASGRISLDKHCQPGFGPNTHSREPRILQSGAGRLNHAPALADMQVQQLMSVVAVTHWGSTLPVLSHIQLRISAPLFSQAHHKCRSSGTQRPPNCTKNVFKHTICVWRGGQHALKDGLASGQRATQVNSWFHPRAHCAGW
jgi:hypothetical protein